MTSAVDGTKVSQFRTFLCEFKLILCKAMVTRVSARNHGGGVRLKAAAAFTETGDIRDTVEELWKGSGDKKQTLIDTVRKIVAIRRKLLLTDAGNRLASQANK